MQMRHWMSGESTIMDSDVLWSGLDSGFLGRLPMFSRD